MWARLLRYTLLGIEPPSTAPAGAGLLPPLANVAAAGPGLPGAAAPLPLPPALQQALANASPAAKDIFSRFQEAVGRLGLTPANIFAM